MKVLAILYFFFLLVPCSYSKLPIESNHDSIEVIKLNKLEYDSLLTDDEQTIEYVEKILKIEKKINYLNGIGEAYRVKGIGFSYLEKSENAIENYLNALHYFKQVKNST